LIYAVEKVEPYATLLGPVWQAGKARAARLISSELLIIETLTGPLKQGDRALIDAYEQVLAGSDIELLPVSATVLKQGATLRATYGLKTPHAIHAATALQAGCSMFITNDAGFRRVLGLAPTLLSDFALAT
jgi:predicted nucleic acid-binding protein